MVNVAVVFYSSDENNCIPPNIPNAKYTEDSNGWYKDQRKIIIKCDKGYDPKDHHSTAQCINGTWSSVPICESKFVICFSCDNKVTIIQIRFVSNS